MQSTGQASLECLLARTFAKEEATLTCYKTVSHYQYTLIIYAFLKDIEDSLLTQQSKIFK